MYKLLSSEAFHTLFSLIFNMSITASIMIGIVLLLRLALRKAPRIFSYALWAVVLFRLLCPVSFQAPFSVLGLAKAPVTERGEVQFVSEEVLLPKAPVYMPQQIPNANAGNIQIAAPVIPEVHKPLSPAPFLVLVWLAGSVVLLCVNIVSLLKTKKKVACSIRLRDNIYLVDEIGTPFCLGFIRPRIYLPSFLSGEEQEYIIMHEKHHLHRGDHIIKAFAFLALCIHWFNPFVWLAFLLAGKDMEMSCDEAVMNKMNGSIRAQYSAALLHLSTGRKAFNATLLSFGDGNPKQRIKNIMNYRKPAFWLVIVLTVALVAVAVCLIANPRTERGKKSEKEPASEVEGNDSLTAGVENALNGEGDSGEIPETQKTRQELERWAWAFSGRDGNTIAEFCTEEVIADLEDRELLYGTAGNYGFGMSSPWPWSGGGTSFNEDGSFTWDMNGTTHLLWHYSNNSAVIYYYALTSDPHITCWIEALNYEWKDGKLIVTNETLEFYDRIDNAEDYEKAYPYIGDTGMDYRKVPAADDSVVMVGHGEFQSLGEILNRNACTSSSKQYSALFEPETAAIALLNLSDDPKKVKIEKMEQENPFLIGLEITFLEDHKSYRISMMKPYGEVGIWIPADYQIDVVARFQRYGIEELRSLPFREDNIRNASEVVCIGEIPGKDIRIYGYGDGAAFQEGVAVQVGNKVEYYDWSFASPRAIPPKLYWDEKNKRLQMAFYIYTGTGLSGEALHIIDTSQREWVVGEYLLDDYCADLKDKIVYEYDNKYQYITLYDAQSREKICRAKTYGKPTGLEMGCIMEFELGEELRMNVNPGYYADNSAVVEYDGLPWIGFGVSDQPDEKTGKLKLKEGILGIEKLTDNYYQEVYDMKAIEEGKPVEMLPKGDFYPVKMLFSSGAGGWQTELTLEQDGSFTGRYTNDDRSENQIVLSDFTGEFGDFRRINENAYGMTLKGVTVLNPDRKEWRENGSRYVLGDPYGISGDYYIFYLPDTPLEALSDGFLSWRPGPYKSNVLSCYGLLNVREEYGFFGEE